MTRRVDAVPEDAQPIFRSQNQQITIHAQPPIGKPPFDPQTVVWVTNGRRPKAKPLETRLGTAVAFGTTWVPVERGPQR